MAFWQGLFLITSVHLLAAASPGPDFLMVTQQTLVHGRRTGLWCSAGIALGLGVHIAYSIGGLAATIAHSLSLLWAIKLLGGSYLVFIGVKALRSQADTGVPASAETARIQAHTLPIQLSAWRSFAKGFLCNVLNPKAPVYFVSLFTVVLSPDMPLRQLLAYGLWMMVLQMGWFSAVVLLLAQPRLQGVFRSYSHWINRVCGAVMLALGVRALGTLK